MQTLNKFNSVVLFKEEAKNFLQHWKYDAEDSENDWWKSCVTIEQLDMWTDERKLTQDQLSMESVGEKNCLMVYSDILCDMEAVGSCSVSQARKYFEDNENMRWPADGDIVRMGVFFHWGYYRTLNMVLKVNWEKYLKAKAWGVMKFDQCDGLSDLLKNSIKAIEQFSLTFFDDVCYPEIMNEWFELMEEYNLSEYDAEKFRLLVQEYCNNKLFLTSINNTLWEQFIEEKEEEKKQASDEYWQHKIIWATREGELEQAIYQYGQAKIGYRFLTNKWYKHFGDDYLKVREFMLTNKVLQNRILLKSENPEITAEEMIEEEQKNFSSSKKEYQECAKESAERKSFTEAEKIKGSDSVTGSLQIKTDYYNACKKILKRIWRLTHPDSIQHTDFTDRQIEILYEKFESSLEINERIAQKGSDDFDLLELNSLLSEVENIWNTIGRDIPDYDVIIGETDEEKVAWLKNRILYLEKQIEQLLLRVKTVENNADYIEKKECCASERNIDHTKNAFRERIETLQRVYDELVEQCEKMEISTEVRF